jgi:hypothetical protein
MPSLTLPPEQPNYLDTYSKILNLQKEQAAAAEAQIHLQERKNMIGALNDLPNHPEAFDEQGVPKPDYMLNLARENAPSSMGDYIDPMQTAIGHVVEIAQKSQTLNRDENGQVGTAISGIFGNPEAVNEWNRKSDIVLDLDRMRGTLTPRGQKLFDQWRSRLPLPDGANPDGTLSKDQKNHLAVDGMLLARPILTAGELVGPSGVGTKQPVTMTAGGQTVTGTVEAPALPNAGEFSAQTFIGHTPPPGYGWGVDQNGNPFIYNTQTGKPATARLNDKNEMVVDVPGGNQSTPTIRQVGAGQVNNPNAAPRVPSVQSPSRIPGPGEIRTKAAITGALGDRASVAIQAANNSPRALDALSRAYDILDKPTGPATGGDWLSTAKKSVLNTLAGMGIAGDTSADINTLVKNLAQAEVARAGSTGMSRSDMAQDLNAAASGQIKIDATSLKRIIRQTMATEMMVRAFGNAQQRANGDPAKLAANEEALRNIPRVIEGYQIRLSRNKQEANDFLAEHNISFGEMQDIQKRIKAFESGGL